MWEPLNNNSLGKWQTSRKCSILLKKNVCIAPKRCFENHLPIIFRGRTISTKKHNKKSETTWQRPRDMLIETENDDALKHHLSWMISETTNLANTYRKIKIRKLFFIKLHPFHYNRFINKNIDFVNIQQSNYPLWNNNWFRSSNNYVCAFLLTIHMMVRWITMLRTYQRMKLEN